MKTAAFALVFAFMGTAFSQEIFRCGCADANGWLIRGVEALCVSKGGEAQASHLCIRVPTTFTDEECTAVQAGAKGKCIVDTISDQTGSTFRTTVTRAPQTSAVA
ncbi:hypothetical protein CH63R_07985 [Colletotrichum higginsianum IMI 349063]|uniref:Uncharacterized protein n=2 Tax=Colletotrichum higginsianum TaxID=80884 RepID=A0A1B7YBK4_COLHI|nr:hypothetical protein CH63R_07985 [Colletotrichum higginsianum IMI 349063]OBR09220.1 hypothetical protein CH63R_07985 [Colletotrichum higginsianum IMI 349063]TIC94991.1 hypothetical protein CH35J_008170 [Colletotrichum higginsianum]GJC96727.1 hypothetical protein ColKHC_05553 [Colletotrichum higginsianum]